MPQCGLPGWVHRQRGTLRRPAGAVDEARCGSPRRSGASEEEAADCGVPDGRDPVQPLEIPGPTGAESRTRIDGGPSGTDITPGRVDRDAVPKIRERGDEDGRAPSGRRERRAHEKTAERTLQDITGPQGKADISGLGLPLRSPEAPGRTDLRDLPRIKRGWIGCPLTLRDCLGPRRLAWRRHLDELEGGPGNCWPTTQPHRLATFPRVRSARGFLRRGSLGESVSVKSLRRNQDPATQVA
ncbi:hypothetical protein NDU88_010314 [Pleurodeles waltl]|uniref:Uncharacterized protein n=1 Tax=Pleurodeles waltl TaxID=8319 RepID=A0AAV7S2B2_PLEWA|nr:hypothetical protein NDU88_010314 [Pleurodeles waltl]